MMTAGLALAACRPDPGTPDYASQETFDLPDAAADAADDTDFLEGPDPFEPGDQRLGYGAFYEGQTTTTIPVDDLSTFLYIYENTLGIEAADEHVEGLAADRLVHAGGPWWGMGIHFDTERDLSGWDTLHLNLRSADAAFADVEIGMNDSDTRAVMASDYGYANDDAWHHVVIPMSDLAAEGLDIAAVSAGLVLLGGSGDAGASLLVDGVYLSSP